MTGMYTFANINTLKLIKGVLVPSIKIFVTEDAVGHQHSNRLTLFQIALVLLQ